MSRTSIKEKNKAIRKAWEREQQLVQEGKGTRDWTKEQQKDILDPDKGKAYDDQGRAFEGQHMKSAAEYPKDQGNPDNIQFLTRDEHLEAHKGSWQNPTNWYYDPVIKGFHDFGEGEIIPCKIIELSDPIIVITKTDSAVEKSEKKSIAEEGKAKSKNSNSSKNSEEILQKEKRKSAEKTIKSVPSVTVKAPKSEGKFIRGLKTVGRFIVDHPVESLEIAGVAIGGVAKIVSSISGSRSNNAYTSETSSRFSTPAKSDIASKVADIVEKANRSLPHENDVTGHRQRYHTKDGVIWKDKAPYHRGGKDS